MSQTQSMSGPRIGVRSNGGQAASIRIVTLGLSLSVFFVISYVICILGLVESFIWGWYIALVFGPIYNFFSRRLER